MEEISAFTRFIDILHAQPVFTLFLIFGMGYLIGNICIGSFSLGPVAGVLFAGLFIGQFGLRMPAGTQAMGFALFIFSVGYQAGPRFLMYYVPMDSCEEIRASLLYKQRFIL